VRFELAALLTAAVVAFPLLAASSGHAARDVLLGTGDDPDYGGTLLAGLHLQGDPLFLATRLAPLVVSFLLAVLVVRRLGHAAALEPVALVSLVALSLSMRLVFESSLYGYYFMALVVALVLLDVVRGHIRAALVVWLIVMSLVALVGWTSSNAIWSRVSWGDTVQHALPPVVLVLAVLIAAFAIIRRGRRRDLLPWLALAVGVVLAWPSSNNPLSSRFTTADWQIALVLPGIVLAALPLHRLMREPRDPIPPSRLPPEVPAPHTR